MKWSPISNYQWSGSNDFTLNSDSITIRQSGLYLFYYQERIKGSDNGSQKGYIVFSVVRRGNYPDRRYTEKVGSDSLSTVVFNFCLFKWWR